MKIKDGSDGDVKAFDYEEIRNINAEYAAKWLVKMRPEFLYIEGLINPLLYAIFNQQNTILWIIFQPEKRFPLGNYSRPNSLYLNHEVFTEELDDSWESFRPLVVKRNEIIKRMELSKWL